MNLTARLLLLVLVAALPVFGLQVAEQLEQRDQRRTETASQVRQLAQMVTVQQDRFVASARYLLSVLAQLPELRARDPVACGARLVDFQNRFPEIAAIAVATPDGRVRCSSDGRPPADLAARDYFQRALRDRVLAISGYVAGPTPDGATLDFAQPVQTDLGRIEFVLVASYSLRRLSASLAATPLPPGAVSSIMDRNGVLIARTPDTGRYVGQSLRHLATTRQILEGQGGTFEGEGIDGVQRFYGFGSMAPPAELSVVVGLPHAGVFAVADRMFWRQMLFLTLAFALAAGAAMVGGELGIRRPIVALRRVVRRMARGDLSARAAAGGGGISELAGLARSIGGMAAALETRESELRQATAEAERAREEAERSRRAAEQATEAKTRFFAAASHDLRQPFQAMRLFLHLLDSRIAGEEAKLIARHLGDSMQAGEDLINTLLDVSTIESGRVRVQRTVFAIDQVVARLSGEFAPQARARGLALTGQSCRLSVRSDPVLVERILRNLLSNAIRYTERGRILIGCRRRGDMVRLEVWDTGPGIPEDKLQAIFEEFRQLNNPARARSRGVGLGLAIVDRLARLLGHRLAVRSRVGRGSVFALELPQAAGAAAEPQRPAAVPRLDGAGDGRLAGVRIIVIEDDAVQRVAIKHILCQWGCDVAVAPSLDAAMMRIEAGGDRPDLILTDLRLPGRHTGFEVIERIRANLDSRLPAIVLTGETDPAKLPVPPVDNLRVLYKPLDPQRLGSAIAEMIGRTAA